MTATITKPVTWIAQLLASVAMLIVTMGIAAPRSPCALSVSRVSAPTPGIGSAPHRSLPAAVSPRPETGLPGGFDR